MLYRKIEAYLKSDSDSLPKKGFAQMMRIKQSVVVQRYITLYPLERNQHITVEAAFEKIISELGLKC